MGRVNNTVKSRGEECQTEKMKRVLPKAHERRNKFSFDTTDPYEIWDIEMTYSGQGITCNCQIMDYHLFGGGSGNMKKH